MAPPHPCDHSFTPSRVQGAKCEVVVVFRPSSQRPYYMDTLQVAVPNQQEQLNVPVRVRAEGFHVRQLVIVWPVWRQWNIFDLL